MDKLKETASNKDREEIKNRAVEVRESGDLAQAKELLEQVIDWDEKNDNPRGEIDALGHLRIVYSNMAEEEKDAQVKQSLKEQARGCVEKALVIIDARPEIPQDSRSILQVHLASTIFETAKENTDPTFKVAQLEKALQVVKDAMETLPGSQAHKAWPANLKAKILYEMGKKEEAWDVLMQAEKWIYGGYNQEVVNGDQAEIKLNVWLSGLMLTKAEICKREGKTILARHYTEYIVSMNDSTNSLSQRKKDAQIILQSI